MKLVFGADDLSPTVDAVLEYLRTNNHTVEIVSSDQPWPSIAHGVARTVADGQADFGIVMCWTGTGTAIAANKVPGIRAAVAWEPWIAKNARLWNDANVLAMSLKRIEPDMAVEITAAFLNEPTSEPEELKNIAMLENWQDI